MKRFKGIVLAVVMLGLLTGCSKKFSPQETAVSVDKDGVVTAAVLDKLDQSYYDAEELKSQVEKSVSEYNGTEGEDTITVEQFDISEEGDVKLFMKYASAEDYAAFNNVDFYAGDITNGYNKGGYRFEIGFQEVEKGELTGKALTREEIFKGQNHYLVVFTEPMGVEVPGNILYVSDNVEITGKRSARMKGSGAQPESESESENAEETAEGGAEVIQGVLQNVEETEEDAESTDVFAYVIYE